MSQSQAVERYEGQGDLTPALEQTRSLMAIPEHEWQRMWTISRVIADSQMVPKVLRGNPQGVMAVGLHCRALQVPFDVMSFKGKFHVWEDTRGTVIQPSAQLMLGLLHRAGHEAWWGECDETKATLFVRRAGSTREEPFTYTIEMARRANLLSKDNWKYHPSAMLRAAVARMACRYAAPDALLGLDAFDRTAHSLADQPHYDWEPVDPALDDVAGPGLSAGQPERPPNADLSAQKARLMARINSLPPAWRSRLTVEWTAQGLPTMGALDHAGLLMAEDLVTTVTADALAGASWPSSTAEGERCSESPSTPGGGGSDTATAGRRPTSSGSSDASAVPASTSPDESGAELPLYAPGEEPFE